MTKSRINLDYEVKEGQWLISIINTGSKSGGHAALVVEGIENDPIHPFYQKYFIGQYDIAANAEDEQKSSINTKGYITKIKVFENEECKRNYEQLKYPVQSYQVSPLNAKKMIASIKRDAVRTEIAMHNLSKEAKGEQQDLDDHGNIIKPFRFQYLGKNHPLVKFFGNTDDGNNCAGWCLEKLTDEAGIEDHTRLPKPKVVAGQCVIL